MFDERQGEIAEYIGRILLDIIPDDAVKITAKADVDEDYAGTGVEFESSSGAVGHFSMDTLPRDAVGDISDAFIDLRDVMLADGHDPWYGITFTVDRDGHFDVNFSYAPPED